MSVLRPSLSRRVGLALVAAALLLTGTLVAAPSVSGAPPARVKQFVASLSGGVGSSLTVTVTNCGGPTLPPECGAPSTIGLGAVQIAVPTGFQPASNVHASSGGTTWTNASYNPATKSVEVISPGGTNKLNPGQALVVTFDVPTTSFATCEGTNEFTTKAWGANAIAGSDPFEIKSSQPSLACSGSTVTGPNGQTETVSGFGGSVIVTFGGDLSCSFDPIFGSQWSQFNLPTQVNIIPGPGFVAQDVIISTSRFPTEGNDSSLYLICYAVPTADHSTFVTRDGSDATTRTVNGVESYVGILPNCYDPIAGTTLLEPCVSEQFLDVTTNPDQIVISVRIPPADPGKR